MSDSTTEQDTPENTDETADAAGTDSETRERMERALKQIRREGWKAAFIYAIVDALAVFLAVNLAVTLFDPSWTPSGVAVPRAVLRRLDTVLGVSEAVTVPGSALLAGGVALVVVVVEMGLRVRRPVVEQFEAGNPSVAEALRTARDAVEQDTNTRMASRLYEDVLDRLRETSSVALVDLRRVGVTLLVALLLSGGTVQVAVSDFTIADDGAARTNETAENESVTFSGLQDGDSVLGDAEDVEAGEENLTARVESTGGSEELDGSDQFPSGGGTGGGASGAGGTDTQQAGFAQPEEIEDAQLIREYNIRIRESAEDN